MVAACRLHGDAQRCAGQAVDRQQLGGLAAEDPGGRVVGDGQALEARAHRRLTEDEADPRRLGRPAVGVRVVAQPGEAGRAGQAEERRRGALAEAPQVLAEPRLDRTLGPASRRWMNPRTLRNASSNASHGLRSRNCVPDGGRTWPDETRSAAFRPGPVPSRLAGRIAWRSARRRAAMTGAARRSLSIRSRIAPRPTSWRPVWRSRSSSGRVSAPADGGEPGEQRGPHRVGADIGLDPLEVVGVERRLAQLRAAALVAADRAAVVPGDRPHPAGDARLVVDRPDDLVDDEGPAARRAAGREHVADRDLEAGFTPRRGGQALEGGVEVADVRRSQHDLGEHPSERARFERDRAPLAVDGGPGDPAATAEQVGHDVARPGVRDRSGRRPRGRRRRRQAVEDG